MKAQRLRSALQIMASQPDILGCALVSLDDGMLWHAEGRMFALEALASSSSDYWRLNRRTQESFERLGELQVAVLMHRLGQVVISECGTGMLLILVTERIGGVDWARWKAEHARLATLVNGL